MSQIENSRICPITPASSAATKQLNAEGRLDRSADPKSSFLDSPLRARLYRLQTSNEKRLNYVLQSRRASDGRFPNESQPGTLTQTDMFTHSKNRSPFEFWQNLRQSENEQNTEEQLNKVTNSSQTVEHLEAAISNVKLEDGMASDNNNCVSTETQANVEKVDVECEVETVQCEGGVEIFDVEATSVGTREAATTGNADTTQASAIATLQILAAFKQEQNLKPILKRKDFVERFVPLVQSTTLPPPILKKRDSFNETVTSVAQSTVSNVLNAVSQQVRPASILKNRQPRGSYSFDENINSHNSSTSLDDGIHHLKPILKKKSWSIEEKVPSNVTHLHASECVKGILKSSDKLTASSSVSSSSSLKNSIIDDCTSCYSLPCSTTSVQQIKSTASPTKATLKGILKSSPKNCSASISPCSSSESIVNEPEIDRVPLSPKPINIALRRRFSLEEESSKLAPMNSNEDYDVASNNHLYLEDTNADADETEQASISSVNVMKPILKKASALASSLTPSSSSSVSSIDCLYENASPPSELCLSSNQAFACFSSPLGTISSDSVESVSKVDIPDSSENKSDDDSSMHLTVFRRNKNVQGDAARSRPKSCFVTSSEFLAVQPNESDDSKLANNSIAQRLALLKQNGEEGWKNRVNKSDVEKEIQANLDEVKLRPKSIMSSDIGARSSVIANRLSSLVESQTQWKNRVNESDAKQFNVASKHSQQSNTDTNSRMDPNEKVVLRGTPKRLGLRCSTLNESALNSVSSKLNSVLRPDKSLLSCPVTPIKKKEESSLLLNLQSLQPESKPSTAPTSAQTVFLPKPDDEESFGSFFGLDNHKLDHILGEEKATTKEEDSPFLSLDSLATESRLLSNLKRSNVQAPKRRAASSNNPIKQLNKSCISVDSYSNVPNSPIESSLSSVLSAAKPSAKANPNMAISALAGLASTEDFKSVASKLRNSSSVSSQSNDTWRAYDLKNSLQSRMLILVKGRRHAQIRLIEPSWRSLNLTDSFILVTKELVYAFIGQFSNIIERTKCIEVAEQIRKRKEMCYRSSSNDLVLVDGHTDSVKSNLFAKLLPLLKEMDFDDSNKADWDKLVASSMSDVSIDEDDEYYEESLIGTNMIYDVVLNESKSTVELVPVEKYWGRSPRHQLLQPDSVFIFDFGTEMYIWIGKNVSNILRKKAVDAAKDLWHKGYDYSEIDISPFGETALKSEKRPDWAWFTRTNQNMETTLFKDKFFNWPAFTLTRSVKKSYHSSFKKFDSTKDTKNTHHSVKKDLSQELNLFAVEAKKEMIDKQFHEPNLVLENVSLGRGSNDIIKDEDGLSVKIVSLDVQCFFIDDNGEQVELINNDRNFLFTGESYYIRWKYRLNRISRCLKTGGESKHSEQHGGRDRLCYFVWQGKDARNTQRGTTALNAIDKLREEGASQEIIENGKEFPAFLRIFDGNLVIQLGKRNQVTNNKNYRMFSLKSCFPDEMYLTEVECSAKNLRSRSSFIFISIHSKVIYIWHGCKSSQEKRRLTKNFLDNNLLASMSEEFGFSGTITHHETVEVDEGNERKDFFTIFNLPSAETSPRRSSRANLQREIYFSLMDDNRVYDFTPRLFHFSTSADRIFEATEIVPSYMTSRDCKTNIEYPFTQDDIYVPASSRPTFFLFDNNYEVYLWESKFPFFILGLNKCEVKSDESVPTKHAPRMIDIESEILSEANLTTGFLAQLWLAERKCALETTLAYCHAKNSTEPPKAYVISAGLEPHSFCGLFPTWNYYENVAQLHIEDGRKPGQQILVQEVLAQIRDIHSSNYSYEILIRRPLPEGINILCLESYLDDQEFEKAFGFNREEFYALPTWKQKTLKQEKELF